MEVAEFTQLGIAGLTLGILFFIVQWFVKSMNKKDDRLYQITDQFNKTIGNNNKIISKHMKDSNKAIDRLDEHFVHVRGSLDANTRILGQLFKLIDRNDKKGGN